MNISNYRPILLLTLFSKVFEEVMNSRFMGYLSINKVLVEEHCGFRKNLATEEATNKLTNEILRALNNMSMVDGIFCDLEKAFDSVSHEILSKVTYYGIIGKAKFCLFHILGTGIKEFKLLILILTRTHFLSQPK